MIAKTGSLNCYGLLANFKQAEENMIKLLVEEQSQ
jgi:hypothetical protein